MDASAHEPLSEPSDIDLKVKPIMQAPNEMHMFATLQMSYLGYYERNVSEGEQSLLRIAA